MRRTKINPKSAAKIAVDAAYKILKKTIEPFMTHCARCGIHGKGWSDFDPHHPFGRGKGKTAWRHLIVLPLCRSCHNWVHDHAKQAKKDGWLIEPKEHNPYEI